MKIIGLCGGSGAGKTTASEAMRLCGAAVIDTDRVYREISGAGSECLSELAFHFGDGIILSDGTLDRKTLGAAVYADAQKRELLNTVTHRYIKNETEIRIARYRGDGAPAVIVDAPLLFESGFDLLCDTTVGIVAEKDIRIKRIMDRDGITEEHANARIRAQYSDEYLRERCEYILENNSELAELVIASAKAYISIMSGIKQ